MELAKTLAKLTEPASPTMRASLSEKIKGLREPTNTAEVDAALALLQGNHTVSLSVVLGITYALNGRVMVLRRPGATHSQEEEDAIDLDAFERQLLGELGDGTSI